MPLHHAVTPTILTAGPGRQRAAHDPPDARYPLRCTTPVPPHTAVITASYLTLTTLYAWTYFTRLLFGGYYSYHCVVPVGPSAGYHYVAVCISGLARLRTLFPLCLTLPVLHYLDPFAFFVYTFCYTHGTASCDYARRSPVATHALLPHWTCSLLVLHFTAVVPPSFYTTYIPTVSICLVTFILPGLGCL